jgi:hypothetical protein
VLKVWLSMIRKVKDSTRSALEPDNKLFSTAQLNKYGKCTFFSVVTRGTFKTHHRTPLSMCAFVISISVFNKAHPQKELADQFRTSAPAKDMRSAGSR